MAQVTAMMQSQFYQQNAIANGFALPNIAVAPNVMAAPQPAPMFLGQPNNFMFGAAMGAQAQVMFFSILLN